MTDSEKLAYFAGLADGEAYIGIIKASPSGRAKSPSFISVVTLEMTNEEAVTAFAALFGLAHGTRKTSRGKKRKTTFWANAPSQKASRVLSALLPFLKIKRPVAELGMALQNHIQERRKAHKSSIQLSKEELEYRDSLHQQAKALNKRGVD